MTTTTTDTDEKTKPVRRRSGSTTTTRAKKKQDTQPADDLKASDVQLAGLLAGSSRQTLPTNANVVGMLPWAYLPRRQYGDIDLASLPQLAFSPQQLMELLADASPEVSLALSNDLRLATADWTYEVRTPDNSDALPDAKAALDALLAGVNRYAGGFEAVLTQFAMTTALEGACAGETIPTPTLDGVADITPVQPWTIYYQRSITQDLIPFQWQPMIANAAGLALPNTAENIPSPSAAAALLAMGAASATGYTGFRMLNRETFGYVPFEPFVDDPYGRMPYASVVQTLAFLAQLLKDLRQWAHVNAFGRMDVSVLLGNVDKAIPPAVKQNPEERMKFLQGYLTQIQTAYNGINPDDTFVHYDDVVVSGVDSTGQTLNIDNIIRVVERQMFRALKQLPIMMGSNEGTTETWGSIQMEVHALRIQALQKTVAALAAHLLTVALRLSGIAGVVHFEFEKIRSTDQIKDATAERLRIQNAAAKRDEGWTTQDEASIEVTGSEAVGRAPSADDVAAPNQPTDGGQPGDATPAPVKPAAEPAAAATKQDDATGDGKGNNTNGSYAKTSGDEGRLLTEALARTLAAVSACTLTTPTRAALSATAHHSAARKAHAAALREQIAGHFRAATVSEELLRHIVSVHAGDRAAAVANARQTAPVMADALHALRDGGELSADERTALLASIAKMLEVAFPNDGAALATLLSDARTSAWNAAGQEALAALGISADDATFALTNTALLARIRDLVAQRVAGIQQTTRQRHATIIADDLQGYAADQAEAGVEAGVEAGAATDVSSLLETLASDLRAALDRMANGGAAGDTTDAAAAGDSAITARAESIASYETNDAWGEARVTTWSRNAPDAAKTWETDGDPDPHAGASGATPCRDNAYASPIPIDDTFPSGDDHEPAHTGCYCVVTVTLPADFVASATPWTGD